jgi:hypothetical protein
LLTTIRGSSNNEKISKTADFMKGIFRHSILYAFFILMVVGCSKTEEDYQLNQLTRVDVQAEGVSEIIISKEREIKVLRDLFSNIEWESNVKVDMSRKEDLVATLFFTYDPNMPERLLDYAIWFNESDSSATIVDRENQALGTLQLEWTKGLKDIFMEK